MSYRSELPFKLVIYESEYRQIQAWTNKYEQLETGGDLFGLWQDERTAVVQLVVGPGKQCRRTSTSFYQDVDYLERIGDALTSDEGLCHIGEWHSHHTLGLSSPSEGDESTIWSNMDRYGLSRFVLFIANICTRWSWPHLSYLHDETTVNGFLFEVDRWKQAEFICTQEESPFRSKYFNVIREGAESSNTAEDQLRVVLKNYQQMKSELKEVHLANQKLETSLAAEEKARKETCKQLLSSEQRVYELQKSLNAERQAAKEEAERRVLQQSEILQASLDKESQAREETEIKQLHYLLQQQEILQSSVSEERQAREEAELQLYHNDQGSRLQQLQLEITLAEEQKAHEETRRKTSRDWWLDRNEITLPDTRMRGEEWVKVVEGSFCKCKVGVKVVQKHDAMRLDQSFFEREMKMAFECRHPCLLQFFGVTRDDQSLLFVSELQDTRLSAIILPKQPLETSEVTTIALDVAKGLNYLHLKRPCPIVHGGISSANVLLWKRGGAGWQAKISDFYTMNILQAMTNSSFNSVYAAPEAQTHKFPKVDVYSFGILLWEMNLGKVPDRNDKNLDQLKLELPCFYKGLIEQCINEDPEKRLSMEEIIEEIENNFQQLNFSKHI